jgi:hypothetical protein
MYFAAGSECINDPEEHRMSRGTMRCSRHGFKCSNERLMPKSADFLFSKKSRTMLILVVILEGGGSGRRGRYVQVGRDELHF